MAIQLKEKDYERKLEEADRALDHFLSCLEGVGTLGGDRITLFIKKVRDDGQGDSRKP